MKELNVHVTEGHIKHGIKRSCSYSPVLNAINDKLKPNYWATLSQKGCIEIHLFDEWEGSICQFAFFPNTSTALWMYKFDNGLCVEPFKFTLCWIPESMIL